MSLTGICKALQLLYGWHAPLHKEVIARILPAFSDLKCLDERYLCFRSFQCVDCPSLPNVLDSVLDGIREKTIGLPPLARQLRVQMLSFEDCQRCGECPAKASVNLLRLALARSRTASKRFRVVKNELWTRDHWAAANANCASTLFALACALQFAADHLIYCSHFLLQSRIVFLPAGLLSQDRRLPGFMVNVPRPQIKQVQHSVPIEKVADHSPRGVLILSSRRKLGKPGHLVSQHAAATFVPCSQVQRNEARQELLLDASRSSPAAHGRSVATPRARKPPTRGHEKQPSIGLQCFRSSGHTRLRHVQVQPPDRDPSEQNPGEIARGACVW